MWASVTMAESPRDSNLAPIALGELQRDAMLHDTKQTNGSYVQGP